jgi:hypothetical protein
MEAKQLDGYTLCQMDDIIRNARELINYGIDLNDGVVTDLGLYIEGLVYSILDHHDQT